MAVSRRVRDLFEAELTRRGIGIQETEEGGYLIPGESGTSTVSLDNLARTFDRDGDESAIARFADTILKAGNLIPKTWDEAQPRIRWAVESVEVDLGDTLCQQFSDQARMALVVVSPDETQVAFLTPDLLERWGQTRPAAMQAAGQNMAELLAQLTLRVEEIEGYRLGMFESPDDFVGRAFKAAFLLCPEVKALVEPVLGWPVFAVMPSRDFVYLVPQEDVELLPRLGPTVVREYHKSGYPISKEVFEIADEGIRAISEYQSRDGKDPLDAAEGMKTIEFQGGAVTFRIPTSWEGEYGEDGSGTFYDEEGTGALELSVLTLQSEKPITEETFSDFLDRRADETGGELARLASGDVCLAYEQRIDEGGEERVSWWWEITHLVPPHHARLARFSYSVEVDLADDAEVMSTLAMLREELSRCTFGELASE